ncbi:MAG: polysaccharide deacetylase family protein [Clostridia bacterium]|nr:polysaccharide deacetylase family protein [Clostridia bacterium]
MKATLLYPNGKEKALTLSYDDGVDTDIDFIKLLEKYDIKCTFNINSGLFAPEGARLAEGQIHFRLPESKIKEIYSNELCEVATHGYTHPFLEKIPTAQCMLEILKDRQALEKLFGKIIRGHAYPFGTYNDKVIEILKDAGIVYARTINSQFNFELPQNWLKWHPTCHHAAPELAELAEKFIGGNVGRGDGWLFYLWGHTYEFRRDNNWDVIVKFFEKVAGNDNVWYATNIEVYNYIEAYRKLVYSADADMIYNPTDIDIWVRYNEEKICVPAGKTIHM